MGIGMTIVCRGFTATPDVERLAGVELVGLACAQDWHDCEVVIDAHVQPSGRVRFSARLQLTGDEGSSRVVSGGSHITVADALADAFREAATTVAHAGLRRFDAASTGFGALDMR